MLVCNDNNEVVGVVTRKDLARFRVVHHGSRMARFFGQNWPISLIFIPLREVVQVTEQVQE